MESWVEEPEEISDIIVDRPRKSSRIPRQTSINDSQKSLSRKDSSSLTSNNSLVSRSSVFSVSDVRGESKSPSQIPKHRRSSVSITANNNPRKNSRSYSVVDSKITNSIPQDGQLGKENDVMSDKDGSVELNNELGRKSSTTRRTSSVTIRRTSSVSIDSRPNYDKLELIRPRKNKNKKQSNIPNIISNSTTANVITVDLPVSLPVIKREVYKEKEVKLMNEPIKKDSNPTLFGILAARKHAKKILTKKKNDSIRFEIGSEDREQDLYAKVKPNAFSIFESHPIESDDRPSNSNQQRDPANGSDYKCALAYEELVKGLVRAKQVDETNVFGNWRKPKPVDVMKQKLSEMEDYPGLTKEECFIYIQAFSTFDIDGSGTISEEELLIAMESLGMKLSTKQIRFMIRELDINGDGDVSIDEFFRLIASFKSKKKFLETDLEITEAFLLVDADKNGVIDVEDLMALFEDVGEPISTKVAHEMIAAVRLDSRVIQDSVITHSDFSRLLKNKRGSVALYQLLQTSLKMFII